MHPADGRRRREPPSPPGARQCRWPRSSINTTVDALDVSQQLFCAYCACELCGHCARKSRQRRGLVPFAGQLSRPEPRLDVSEDPHLSRPNTLFSKTLSCVESLSRSSAIRDLFFHPSLSYRNGTLGPFYEVRGLDKQPCLSGRKNRIL